MADMRISEMTTAAGLHDGDLFETAQTDSISSSGYASYKTSLNAIAAFIAKQVQFSGDLQTTSKNLIGAINEVFNAGTSVTVTNVLPATETTKRVATITVDGVAKDINADDTVKVITDLKTPKSATITNGIAQFECIEENLVKGLKVTMSPIQDLHGYDHPWVGGAEKNKFNLGNFSETQKGVTASVVYGKLHLQGTASNGNARFSLPVAQNIPTGSVTFSVSGSNENIRIITSGNNGFSYTSFYGNSSKTFTITDAVTIQYFYVDVTDGTTVNADVAIQIESGSTATTFAPYSNICPIRGRTEVGVTRTAGEDAETHTHQYSETIYGGVDDFVNGGLSNEWGYIASYAGETLPGEWISDRDVYAPGTTPTAGAEVAYKLATPTTISTSAEEITTVAGTNIISGTEPISECKYTELATVDDLIKIIGGAE